MLVSPRAALSTGATFADCDDAHELIDAHDRVAHGPPHESVGALPPQPLTGASFPSVGRSMRVEDALLPAVACVIARISDETVSAVPSPPGCCRAHSVPLPSSESWRRRTLENAADNRRTSRNGGPVRIRHQLTTSVCLILPAHARHWSQRTLPRSSGNSSHGPWLEFGAAK